jgi:hypothetical protein
MFTPPGLPPRLAPFTMILALAACSGESGARIPTDIQPAGAEGIRGLVLAPYAGDGQSGEVGTVLADSLVVELRTPSGNPVPNAAVTWTVVSGGGSVSPGAARTDAQGRVRAAWTLGSTEGPAQVRAAWHGATVVFSATQAVPVPSITVVHGDGQTATRGTLADVRVRVTDAQGTPMAYTEVTAEVLSGGGFLPDGGLTSTDGEGIAFLQWVLGLQPGENRLAVRAEGVPGEVVATATGVDAPLTLVLDWPDLEVVLQPIPLHSSYGAMTYVEASVADPAGNRVWGVPVRFTPNKGEAGAEVLTGTEVYGAASFAWEGWMSESDEELPELVVSYAGQTIRIRATWDSGDRYYQPIAIFHSAEPFAAGTTVRFDAYVEEVNGLSVPRGLPVFLSDDAGWSVETVAGARVDWPLGTATGTRTLTFCVISPSHTCQDFPVQVQ